MTRSRQEWINEQLTAAKNDGVRFHSFCCIHPVFGGLRSVKAAVRGDEVAFAVLNTGDPHSVADGRARAYARLGTHAAFTISDEQTSGNRVLMGVSEKYGPVGPVANDYVVFLRELVAKQLMGSMREKQETPNFSQPIGTLSF